MDERNSQVSFILMLCLLTAIVVLLKSCVYYFFFFHQMIYLKNYKKWFLFHPKSFFLLKIFKFLVDFFPSFSLKVAYFISRIDVHKLADVIFGITHETVLCYIITFDQVMHH